MKLNLDYKFTQKDNPDNILPVEFTVNTLNLALTSAYPQGVEGQRRRLVGRIQRKLDQALDTKAEEIQFEEAEKDELKDAFSKAKFSPVMTKYVVMLEDELANS